MSLYAQALLDVHEEMIVDAFAGGGGASSGIEQAFGRMVDVAINHDAAAIAMHEANHPQTRHYHSDIFEVCPREVTQGRPVGFAWFSPDCTDHSKAKGGKPIRTTKRRSLAWVVTRWAGTVRPRVIMLENVEEFKDWSPLVGLPGNYRRCPKRKGKRFKQWVRSLRRLGYEVEWRELRACDYGAPTIRKRLYLIARCDGKPIVWPEPTHGPGRKPYRTAAECIDWSIPMLSIFAEKEEAKAWGKHYGLASPIRPLADNTMRRIARGVKRFVLDNPKPFLVTMAHADVSPSGVKRWGKSDRDLDEPLGTIQCSCDQALCAANIVSYHHEYSGGARGANLDQPIHTIDCANRHGLVTAFLGQHNGGFAEGNSGDGHSLDDPSSTISTKGPHQSLVTAFLDQANNGFENRTGRPLTEPISTILTESRGHHGLIAAHLIEQHGTAHAEDAEKPLQTISAGGTHHGLVAAHIQRDFGQSVGSAGDEPIGTITPNGGGKAGLVASFLQTYYGQGTGQLPDEPLRTIPTVDRFGFVTVDVKGEPYFIADIAMRMLQPKELYLAQGFRPGYVIDAGANGRKLTKTEQVRMVGNSVSPPVAQALARANCPELVVREIKGRAA